MPMRIVDAHHHLWDLKANRYPWLDGSRPVRFRYGDYSAIQRDYLFDDYCRDAENAKLEVVGSVLMEAEADPADPLAELEWLSGVVAAEGLRAVIAAQAWLDRPDCEDLLAVYGERPLVRGVRHKPRAAPTPDAVQTGATGSLSDPVWRRGYAKLSRYGLMFELQVPWWHLGEARALADDFPDTLIVLNHAGLPSDRSQEALAGWREGMRRLAGADNAVVKLSGLGLPDRPWRLEENRSVVLDAIDIFGIDRAMFGSNFPVDRLTADLQTIFSGYSEIVSGFDAQERDRLFCRNAERIYRLPPIQIDHHGV